MLKKEITAALAMVGVAFPFAMHADQGMSMNQSMNQTNQPTYTQGEMVPRGAMPGGYNQSANYKIDDSYDVYFTANFIYWCLQQDDMTVGNEVSPELAGSLGLHTGTSTIVPFQAQYKPGFQVGLGWNMHGMDNWNLYSEYTWYQNSHTTSASGEVFLGVSGADSTVASNISLNGHFHYNNLNVSLQRPFYFGRKVTANFGWGLRALWISQKLTLNGSGMTAFPGGSFSELSMSGPTSLTTNQKSWGLGPRFELDTNWLLGMGFRLMADAAVSVLYTRYTNLTSSETGSVTYGVTSDVSTKVSGAYNTLRAITETSLGLGWGSYFGNNNDFHFDLSASYEFNIYWNQNMSEALSAGPLNAKYSPRNTYLHGLNVAARFDF